MNIFSNALLQVILVSYPFIFYLFYNSYTINHDSKIKDFLIDISLFSSIYLLSSYANVFNNEYYVIINIPIVLAYALDKKLEGILLSIMAILFYYEILDFNITYLILEYVVYYFLYFIYKKYQMNSYLFLIISLSLKIIIALITVPNLIFGDSIYLFILECILFYIITIFCYLLIKIGDKLIKYSLNIKEIEKEKQIRDMIFKITHEIKNPIAVCKGYLEMINLDNKEKSKKYINNIKGEIEKTLILLQDFLSLRKIQINKDIIDINLLLEENLDVLQNYAKTKNVIMNYDLLEEDIYINGDYNRLGQVIINIVKNSIEAINKRNGEINIYTKIDKENVYIYFEDNGKGISKENLDRIKNESYTTKKNCNGIGILLSNEIIVAHSGELIYDSELGKGTTTIMKLPLYTFKEV